MENDFIKHTLSWCKGELFQSIMVLLVGILCLVITLSLWRFGTTPNAKILIMPALILGITFTATGIGTSQSNLSRIRQYPKTFASGPKKFIEDDKARTERFIKMYAPIRYSMSGLIIIGLIMFLSGTAPSLWKSISIVLITGAFTILIVDYFSEERANAYHYHILKFAAT